MSLTREAEVLAGKVCDLEVHSEQQRQEIEALRTRLRQRPQQMLLINMDGSTHLRDAIMHTGRDLSVASMLNARAFYVAPGAEASALVDLQHRHYRMIYDGYPYRIYVQTY